MAIIPLNGRYLAAESRKQIRLPFGVKDELRKLERTITEIKAVLPDAEEKKETNNQVKQWLDSLEHVIYDADNLVHEFRYQQQRRKVFFGKKKAKKVRIFFSSSNQLVVGLKMAKKIKQIRETLEKINANKDLLQLNERPEETRVASQMRETHSFVIDSEVIGRDKDKNELLKLLLDNNIEDKDSVSVISLVGVGALGKTTLAQLVFNDELVKNQFEKQMWVCVSDVFGLKLLVKNLIRSLVNKIPDENLDFEQLRENIVGKRNLDFEQLRENIVGKRYLLVLDDVWIEDRDKLDRLETILKLGAKGSKVLVTTRSIDVAHVVHSSKIHMLSGLDKDDSWALFKRVAFEDRNYEPTEYPGLEEIGKNIVAKCKGVPLAIKIIGRLLKSKTNSSENLEIREWISFRDIDLAKAHYGSETDIPPKLELSYNHLPSHLKHCFAYCSLFPKNHEIDVQELIRLWIVQGFVKPIWNYGQLEEIGYEYFMILYWGCFFQDAKIDELSGNIVFCKMHDLMHDLARSVAGEIRKDDSDVLISFEKVRHVYLDFESNSSCQISLLLFEQKNMRKFILPKSICFSALSNFKVLRALTLQVVETLPNSFSKLKHLRYLDLSRNHYIEELPNSITELYNLQSLILINCTSLVSLPSNIQNLISLRHLKIEGCRKLTCMPRGIGELTSLQTLDRFVVADNTSNENAGLDELSKLKNLRGDLTIEIWALGESAAAQHYLKDKKHLQSLFFSWKAKETNANQAFEQLEPTQNLRVFEMYYYPGGTLPNWLSSITNLIRLKLDKCRKCKYLPPLHLLPALRELILEELFDLEYVSDSTYKDMFPHPKSVSTISFYPSLRTLNIIGCISLEGWWEREREDSGQQPCFPHLLQLKITHCPDLTSMPLFPNLEKLELYHTSCKPLQETIMMKLKSDGTTSTATTSLSSASYSSSLSKLKDLSIGRVDNLESLLHLAIHNLLSLQSLSISKCSDLRSLPEGIGNLSSLQSLSIISKCSDLRSLLEGIGNLSSLQSLSLSISTSSDLRSLLEGIGNLSSLHSLSLSINNCSDLRSLPEGIGNLSSLQSLSISECSDLVSLPEELSNLACLKKIEIISCCNLSSLPEGIGNLSSLTYLTIFGCSNLTEIPKGICSLPCLEYVNGHNFSEIPMGTLADYLLQQNSPA